jgi:hypothetical protein
MQECDAPHALALLRVRRERPRRSRASNQGDELAPFQLIESEILQMNPKPAYVPVFPGPLARQTRGADRYQHLG